MRETGKNLTSLFIAWRFIIAEKRLKAINIITRISILGVIVGVMTLVVVLSVLNGFQDLARSLFLSVDSDVQITAMSGKHIREDETLLNAIRSLDHVASANYYIEDKAILLAEEKSGVVVLKGLEQAAYAKMKPIMDLNNRTDSLQGIVLGRALAMNYDLYISAGIRLFGSVYLDQALELLDQPFGIKPIEPPVYRVENFFSSHRNFDENYAILPINLARKALSYEPNWVTGMDIRAEDGIDDDELKSVVLKIITTQKSDSLYQVTTLSEKYSQLFDVMELEKWGSFLILMMIIVVASLSLVGSLTMTSIEKKRDLYFLRCMGMQPVHIKQIFFLEGLLIAIIGIASGIILGGILCFLQHNYGLVSLPSQEAFIIDAYPVKVQWVDFLVVAIGSFFVCFVASFYPASRAIDYSETRATH